MALAKARQARDLGDVRVVCGHLRDVQLWCRFARDWARKARTTLMLAALANGGCARELPHDHRECEPDQPRVFVDRHAYCRPGEP
jgi:hypothetical protein